MKTRQLKILVILFCMVLGLIGAGLRGVSSETQVVNCESVLGYELPEELESDALDCESSYQFCKTDKFEYKEGYEECITGEVDGCNKIVRWEYMARTDQCPIDDDNNLDYDYANFQESATHAKGNLLFCECVVKCNAKYRTKKDCLPDLESCCQSIVAPDPGSLQPADPVETKNSADDYAADMPALCRDENALSDKIERTMRAMLEEIVKDIGKRTQERTDLTKSQKSQLMSIVSSATEDARINECGEGSYVSGCKWYTLGFASCMYLDPLSTPDIVRHELGHLVAEKMVPAYSEPGGKSSHNLIRYSSSVHRAYDEGLAIVIAADLAGKANYSSISKLSLVDPLKIDGVKDYAGYDIDLNEKSVKVYKSSLQDFTEYKKDMDSTGAKLEWYGATSRERRQKYQDEIEKLGKEFDKLVADYEAGKSGLNMNQLESKLGRIMKTIQKYKTRLNPPAFSPSNEVAVASLIYDLTGSAASDYRLGKLIQAGSGFTSRSEGSIKSELDFLKGLSVSKSASEVIKITSNQKHNRSYISEDLEF